MLLKTPQVVWQINNGNWTYKTCKWSEINTFRQAIPHVDNALQRLLF